MLFDEALCEDDFLSNVSSLFIAQTNYKMSIQEYIETHNLSKRVEETINAAVKAKAPEPISFMVCKIVVSRLVVSSCFPSAHKIFVKSESFLAVSRRGKPLCVLWAL